MSQMNPVARQSFRMAGDSLILKRMQSQYGLVSRRQVLEAGMTDSQINERLHAGRWVRASRGVYRHAIWPVTPLSRLLGACMTCDALASHRSAAAVHGIEGYELDRFELSVPWEKKPAVNGAKVYRMTQMHLARPVVRNGIPCTGLARTILDLAAVVSRRQLDRTIDAVLRDGLLRASDLYAVLVSHSRNGRAGCGALRETLDERCGDDPVPLSAWSRMIADLLVGSGLPRPAMEYRALDDGGEFVAQVDLAYPSRRLAIELDSKRWHLNSVSFERDPRRRNALMVGGWRVLTFTWSEYKEHPGQLCATVASVYEAAGTGLDRGS